MSIALAPLERWATKYRRERDNSRPEQPQSRKQKAYRMLRDARFSDRSITSIAFDCGFGDHSYFNRSFRRRFGATPSDIRHSQ